MDFLGTLDIKR